jgi:hypothetical protein
VDELAEPVEELPDAAGLRVRRDRVLKVEHDALQWGGIRERQGGLRGRSRRFPQDSLAAGGASEARAFQPYVRLSPVLEEARMVAGVQTAREPEALDGHRSVAEAAHGGGVAEASRRRGI